VGLLEIPDSVDRVGLPFPLFLDVGAEKERVSVNRKPDHGRPVFEGGEVMPCLEGGFAEGMKMT